MGRPLAFAAAVGTGVRVTFTTNVSTLDRCFNTGETVDLQPGVAAGWLNAGFCVAAPADPPATGDAPPGGSPEGQRDGDPPKPPADPPKQGGKSKK